MKTEISINRCTRLISSGNVILVSACYKDKTNIITLAWHTPICHKPPLVGVCIAKAHLSCELIEKSGEFIVNVPQLELLDKAVFCGKVSGREVDKFQEAGLTPAKADKLMRTPVISECIGHIECYVRDIRDFGDHKLFVGEAVYAKAEADLFDGTWDADKVKLIYHLGGQFFTASDKVIRK